MKGTKKPSKKAFLAESFFERKQKNQLATKIAAVFIVFIFIRSWPGKKNLHLPC